MSYIISIIRNIIPKEIPTYLGRWKIDYCNVKINNTVKLANENNCGTCNQYSTDKLNSIRTHTTLKRILPKHLR